MTQKEVLVAIRAHTGPIRVGVLLRNGVAYVQAVKKDLLAEFETIGDDEARTTLLDGILYIDNAV